MEKHTDQPKQSGMDGPNNRRLRMPNTKDEQISTATVDPLADASGVKQLQQADDVIEWWLPLEDSALVTQSLMFVLQPDGTYDMIMTEDPVPNGELLVHEIIEEDGPLIVLTGSNGEVHYNPEDTVTIEIDDDARLFLVDPGESVICYVNVEENAIIEIPQQTVEQRNNQAIGAQPKKLMQFVTLANRESIHTENLQTGAKTDSVSTLEVQAQGPEVKRRRLGLDPDFPSH